MVLMLISMMKKGSTPLTSACLIENETIVKYLIDHGTDVNKMGMQWLKLDEENYCNNILVTPLIIACNQSNENIIKYLIEHGADVNESIEHNNNTPLTVACRNYYNNGNNNIIKYLIDKGANIKNIKKEEKKFFYIYCYIMKRN